METNKALDDRDVVLIRVRMGEFAASEFNKNGLENSNPVNIVDLGLLVPRYMVDTPEKNEDVMQLLERTLTSFYNKKIKKPPPEPDCSGGDM